MFESWILNQAFKAGEVDRIIRSSAFHYILLLYLDPQTITATLPHGETVIIDTKICLGAIFHLFAFPHIISPLEIYLFTYSPGALDKKWAWNGKKL